MTELQVYGMTCGHCVATVTRALKTVDPGARVAVDRASGRVTVEGDAAPAALRAAVEEEGYRVAAA
jgi:copper chaperone